MVVLWQETLRRGHQVDVANWFNGKEFPEKWSQVRDTVTIS